MKRLASVVILSAFALNLTACNSQTDLTMLDTPNQIVQPVNETGSVEISSFKGIEKEIKNASTAAFKELDKDKNKTITPAEYGVATPDSNKSFYALDNNHDGKITDKEWHPGFFKRTGLTLRLRSAARNLFDQLDKNNNKLLSKDELTGGLVSAAFVEGFDKYDKEKKTFLHNDAKGQLSKSEFENLFAHVAVSKLPAADQPAPAPAEPPAAPPAEPPAAPAPAPAEPPAAPPAAPAGK